MGKHSGKKADQPTTDLGKPWGELTGQEKASEFDSSIKSPGAYADRNFGDENRAPGKGKHSR